MEASGALLGQSTAPPVDQHTIQEQASVVAGRALEDLENTYRLSSLSWLLNEVRTVDEADANVGAVKRWPIDKPYTSDFWKILQNEPRIAVPKSRRMMVSWEVAAWCVYKCRFTPHFLAMWQSENGEKADFIVDHRCMFIENNLVHPELRRQMRTIKGQSGLVTRILWTKTEGELIGVPQGPTAFLSYTPSLVVIDESEMQMQADAAINAVLPFVEKGAQLVVMSTPHPLGRRGPLAELCGKVNFERWTG